MRSTLAGRLLRWVAALGAAWLANVPLEARALTAPDFDLASPRGAPWRGRVHLRAERGRVVLVVFWASSCRSCHADLVALERLHRRQHERGLRVVGVATDDARALAALAPTIRRLGLTFPIVADPAGRTCVRYDPLRAFPLAVLIDRRGEIVRSVELRSRARLQALERVTIEQVRGRAAVEGEERESDDDARSDRREPRRPRSRRPSRDEDRREESEDREADEEDSDGNEPEGDDESGEDDATGSSPDERDDDSDPERREPSPRRDDEADE